MPAKFQLKPSGEDKFMFNLVAGNGEVILTSESYTSKANAMRGIESVKKNAPNNERYEQRTSEDGNPYFVLKAANKEVIGTSEMYSSKDAMAQGIASVQNSATHALIAE